MTVLTSVNVATAITKLVAADALPALLDNLIVGNLVSRNFEPHVARPGDTVNIPIDAGNVLGNARIVLDTHMEANFMVPDITKILAVPELLNLYMQPAVLALAEKIESKILSLYSQFIASPPAGAAGAPITEEVLDQAELALFLAQPPPGTAKYLAVDSREYRTLRQLPRFAEYAADEGAVGMVKNLLVFRSTCVTRTGSEPTATHNLAFTRPAIALLTRRLPPPPGSTAITEYAETHDFGMRVTMSYQPGTLSQCFTLDMLYGAGVLLNNNAVQVNS